MTLYLAGGFLFSLQQRDDGSLDVERAASVSLFSTNVCANAAILKREADRLLQTRGFVVFLMRIIKFLCLY